MKKALIFAISLCMGINSMAQVFDKDTILYNGNPDKRINLVILGDGYTSNELSKFVTDATSFTNAFFLELPYYYYKNYFNVIIIKVPSNQSGASHPATATDVTEPVFPAATVDNYFGSAFDYGGIHRLLVANKTSAISNVLANNFPNYDQVLILVNTPEYGGSGGYYTVASTNTSSAQIAIHELGHSFAGLHDEYWAGDTYASEGVNMTKQTDPSLVRWKNWLGTNLIGIYQYCCGGTSAQWYKPHQNCKMQYLGPPFCSVCAQATIEKIHSLASPVDSHEPQASNITASGYPIKFKVSLTSPVPNTLKRSWLLNGSEFKHNADSVLINGNNLLTGNNTLRVTIEDTTGMLRVDNHSSIHLSSVTWIINKSITGINRISSSSSETEIRIYPNPAEDHINISFSGVTKGKIRLEIYDMQGRRHNIITLHSNEVNSIDITDLGQGIYFAKIFVDNNLIAIKKIIRN
jgi:hypothetical protein